MWLPPTLASRSKDLAASGLKIPVSQLYNSNGTGLNNAVVLFGRGCTGEIISPNGLLLTNHHCGYGSVQRIASVSKDYFSNGFWAMSDSEELPCPGLTVTFVRKMENVTAKILAGVSPKMTEQARDSLIKLNIFNAEQQYKKRTGLDASVKPYFEGAQYWISLTETFRDIRLAGFPPNSIGAFGGDVENWSWPRHTGDFSIFRVYAGPGNKPADYSAKNKPYRTSQYFKVSTAGYKEGSFTMVYGFPGTTHEYISSYELSLVDSIFDPVSVAARTAKLAIWNKAIDSSRDIFLKYTAKRAGVANGWKKWAGEMSGLDKCHAIAQKREREKKFQHWADASPARTGADTLLKAMEAATAEARSALRTEQYIKECPLGVELVQEGAELEKVLACFAASPTDSALRDTLKKTAAGIDGFFKNYDAGTDKKVFAALMPLYFDHCPTPAFYDSCSKAYGGQMARWAGDVYKTSIIASEAKFDTFIAHASLQDSNIVARDAAWQLYHTLDTWRSKHTAAALKTFALRLRSLDRSYMKAQMAQNAENASFYPDANLTLRLTYGKVKGLKPDSPAPYAFQTFLKDVVALDDPASDIFSVPAKLRELSQTQNFGQWAINKDVPVAFVATNHTSGGNSGSPVLNARGELIGVNFDRASEGVMSDYYFTDELCRNISVDIRYVLFIIEKFGGDGRLVREMNLVR